MPNYTYNPHQHVKIWLSKNKDVFLNPENQLRLVKMRQTNPKDTIHFVYDSQLLSPKAFNDLCKFSNQHNLIAQDIQSLKLSPLTRIENNLLEVYQTEVTSLDNGGNLAVASDLLRWLSPVYNLGTYTDFDVDVDTTGLPETLVVKSPLLLNVGSIKIDGVGIDINAINNDTLAIVDATAALDKITSIQNALHKSCQINLGSTLSNALTKQKTQMTEDVKQTIMKQWPYRTMEAARANTIATQIAHPLVDWIRSIDPSVQSITLVASLCSKEETPLQFRGRIAGILSTNDTYINSNFAFATNPSRELLFAKRTIAGIAQNWREHSKSQLTWFNWFMMPKQDYESHKSFANETDDNALLNLVRAQLKTFLILHSVVQTSGPAQIGRVFFDHLIYGTAEFDTEVLNYSFDSNGLTGHFKSENRIKPHSAWSELAKMQAAKLGERNDLSWIDVGEKAIRSKEEKMEDSAVKIQRLFRKRKADLPALIQKHKLDITQHINKINADLNGWFGCYQQNQRLEKIKALQSILTHFNEDSFNATAFETKLASYRSDDISARAGKSQKKALVDRLTIFSRQAQTFRVTKPNHENQHLVSFSMTSPV